MTRLLSEWSGVRMSLETIGFSSPKHPRSLIFIGYSGSFPEAKRPDRDVEHSHPTSTEVMNEWSATCTNPIRLHGLDRADFTFFSL